jgi:hypothetical protein
VSAIHSQLFFGLTKKSTQKKELHYYPHAKHQFLYKAMKIYKQETVQHVNASVECWTFEPKKKITPEGMGFQITI